MKNWVIHSKSLTVNGELFYIDEGVLTETEDFREIYRNIFDFDELMPFVKDMKGVVIGKDLFGDYIKYNHKKIRRRKFICAQFSYSTRIINHD